MTLAAYSEAVFILATRAIKRGIQGGIKMGTETNTMVQTTTTGTSTNQEVIATPTEKTFTQADVDRIAKFDEAEEANKSELQKALDKANALQAELDGLKSANAVREIREEVSRETGVPASLLTANTKEDCEAQARAIAEFKGQNAYPAVKDGGDPQLQVKKTTSDTTCDNPQSCALQDRLHCQAEV